MKFDVWQVSPEVIAETEAALRRGKHEVFVMWAGPRSQSAGVCEITRVIIPRQTPESSPFGVAVKIEGSELARIQFDNFGRGEKSYVQVHTHPKGNVEMSRLDRKREVVNQIGALSIIVPNYCGDGLAGFPGVNVYERDEDDWRLWTPAEAAMKIRVRP